MAGKTESLNMAIESPIMKEIFLSQKHVDSADQCVPKFLYPSPNWWKLVESLNKLGGHQTRSSTLNSGAVEVPGSVPAIVATAGSVVVAVGPPQPLAWPGSWKPDGDIGSSSLVSEKQHFFSIATEPDNKDILKL